MLMAGCRRQGNVTIHLFNEKYKVRQSSRLQNHDPTEIDAMHTLYDGWECMTHAWFSLSARCD